MKKKGNTADTNSKMLRKTFAGKVKSVDAENHTVEVIMSDQTADRYNEVVLAKAWKKRLRIYKKHPILLSSHNYYSLTHQIGMCTSIKVEGDQLIAKLKYFVGVGNDEADWGWKLAEMGIAAFSVGFIPHGYIRRGGDGFTETLKEIGVKLKEGESGPYVIYTDVELLENSQVLIPANSNALQKGLEDDDPVVRSIAELMESKLGDEIADSGEGEQPAFTLKGMTDTIEHLQTLVKGFGDDGLPGDSNEEDDDAAWCPVAAKKAVSLLAGYDGEDAESIDFDAYSKAFAQSNPEKVEVRSGYRLLHHDVEDGELVASKGGTVAAMASLLGACGKSKVPESDREAIYEHLSKHYEEFELEVPACCEYKTLDEIASGCSDMDTAILLAVEIGTAAKVREKVTEKEGDVEGIIVQLEGNLKSLLEGEVEALESRIKSVIGDIGTVLSAEILKNLGLSLIAAKGGAGAGGEVADEEDSSDDGDDSDDTSEDTDDTGDDTNDEEVEDEGDDYIEKILGNIKDTDDLLAAKPDEDSEGENEA